MENFLWKKYKSFPSYFWIKFFRRKKSNIIIEQSSIPVVVDAGLAVPSDASKMMEIGADAVLVNTAIAQARNSKQMGKAFKLGVEAGRISFKSGRIPNIEIASPSSPEENLLDA